MNVRIWRELDDALSLLAMAGEALADEVPGGRAPIKAVEIYAVDVTRAARERRIKNVAVTAGHISEKAREEFFSAMDAANIDLKAFTERFYRQLCSAELGPVLDTLEFVKRETNVWLEITTPLIPGCNDSSSEVAARSEWVVSRLGPDVPLHFSAFHPDCKMRDVPATPAANLARAREIAKSAGLRYVYTGNVHDEPGQSTYCHACGARVIGRDWYKIISWALDDNGCSRSCGARCAGVFEESHGAWGARRMPLDLGLSRWPRPIGAGRDDMDRQ